MSEITWNQVWTVSRTTKVRFKPAYSLQLKVSIPNLSAVFTPEILDDGGKCVSIFSSILPATTVDHKYLES